MSNVDNLILEREAQQVVQPEPDVSQSPPETMQTEKVEVEQHAPETNDPYQDEPEPQKAAEIKESASLDEYGSEIAKSRMYSEEEVQRMIRERLQRGQHGQQQQQQIQQEVKSFESDPTNSEPWEKQLDTFIENKVSQLEQRKHRQAWEQQERERQTQFEEKFNVGMTKYGDFQQVVAGKPITDAMMLSTRDMENPAAFIYAASKMQPVELERISKIADPYVQAREMGKLEERLRKPRAVSKTAAPATQVKGDMPERAVPVRNIDALIQQDAKRKYKR